MTDIEWIDVHSQLCDSYGVGIVKLLVDGYNITLITEKSSDLKFVIGVYINGKMHFEWMSNDCEERRRFYCQRKKLLISSKKLANLKISEKKRAEIREKNTYYYYQPYWTSFNAMRKHFEKNNSEIKLVKL